MKPLLFSFFLFLLVFSLFTNKKEIKPVTPKESLVQTTTSLAEQKKDSVLLYTDHLLKIEE